MKFIIKQLLSFFYKIKVENKEVLKQKYDKKIYMCNHQSFLDGLILGCFLPDKPVFVVHTTVLKNPLFRMILKLVDHYAVDPTNPMAIKKIVSLVNKGRPVVIFPEGRITTTGSLMKIYDGTAFIAEKTKATLIPIQLDGLIRSKFSKVSSDYPKSYFPKVSFFVDQPTTIQINPELTSKMKRKEAGEELRKIMQNAKVKAAKSDTLYSKLLGSRAIFGDHYNLVEDITQNEFDYKTINKMSIAMGLFINKYVPENDYFGVLLPNMAPTLGVIFGSASQKRIPALMNFTAGIDAWTAAVQMTEMKHVITSKAFIEKAKLQDKLDQLKQETNVQVLFLEDIKASLTFKDKMKILYYTKFPSGFENDSITTEDPAVLLFTSGSEDKPKGVLLSHENILTNILQVSSVVDFNPSDKVLNALPMFHSFGLTIGSLLPVLNGTKVFLYPTPLHARIIPEIAYDRGCTVLLGTSTFLSNYAKHAHAYDFHKVRYVVAGAEKLSAQTRNTWFEKFGLRILEGYGSTECAPVISTNTPFACQFDTVGQLLPGMEMKLKEISGIDNGSELLVKGKNVMIGYLKWDQPKLIQFPYPEGETEKWYSTGDIVQVNNGFIKIVGRKKRFAKIAGEMISLESIEKAINSFTTKPYAIVSKKDESRGETVILVTQDTELTRDTLKNAIKQAGLPDFATPREIIVADIPMLGTGKTDYVTLNKLYSV